MPRLQSESFATPDQVRNFPHGLAEIATIDESTVGRGIIEPGWRWSTVFDSATRAVCCAGAMARSAREMGLPIRARARD